MPPRLSAATIRAQIRALQKQAEQLERGAGEGLRAAASVIRKYSLSLQDLRRAFRLGKSGGKRGRRSGRRVPTKYADGKGNKWTGRGRTPLWLVAAEKAGKKRAGFLVKI